MDSCGTSIYQLVCRDSEISDKGFKRNYNSNFFNEKVMKNTNVIPKCSKYLVNIFTLSIFICN